MKILYFKNIKPNNTKMKRSSSATKKQSESIVSETLIQSKGMSNDEIIKKISNDRK